MNLDNLSESHQTNDLTHEAHTNQTREATPLLVTSPRILTTVDLGVRTTFADVAKTLVDVFGLPSEAIQEGASFLAQIAG